jgi:PTH1 family peptidyl-tRNA hydrolase
LKDIITHFGEGFWRLRLGVGHPGSRDGVTPWLLSRTGAAEREALAPGVRAAADIVPLMIEQGAAAAMQTLHSRAGPPKD